MRENNILTKELIFEGRCKGGWNEDEKGEMVGKKSLK